MTLDWLPKTLATHALHDAYRNGDMVLGQVRTVLDAQARPLAKLLRGQITQGWWHDAAFAAALTQIEQHHALWFKEVETYIALHQGAFDLPLEYPAAWSAGVAPLVYGDFQTVRSFFGSAASHPKSAFWTSSVLDEAHLHLADAHAAALLGAVREHWQSVFALLLAQAASQPIEAYLARLHLHYQLGDLNAFLDTYEAFRQTHPKSSDSIFPWRDELRVFGQPAWEPHRKQFCTLLDQLIVVRLLQHRADEPDLTLLQHIYHEIRQRPTANILPSQPNIAQPEGPDRGLPMPAALLPTPNPFGFVLPEHAKLRELRDLLRVVRAALTRTDTLGARRSAVLGVWQSFIERHTFDLAAANATLADAPQSGEALGVLQRTLHGELGYYAGNYEDAELAFAAALDTAHELLSRPNLAAAHLATARRFVAFVGQWRGNALFCLADYGAASACYAAMSDYLAPDDREALLLHALNRGNLAFLRNNLVDHRGYLTYDKQEALKLKDATAPELFLGLKYEKHNAALTEAAEQYAAALRLVAALPLADQRAYQPLITANQANIWWMQANLQREAAYFSPALAQKLADLGETSALYHKALAAMQAAHAAASAGPRPDVGLAAALLANISELHVLLDAPDHAIQTALQCLDLLGVDAHAEAATTLQTVISNGVVFPEAGWRVFLTLARAYDALHRIPEAQAAYIRAIEIVAALRGSIRAAERHMAAAQDKFQVFECAMHFQYATTHDVAAMFDLAEQVRSQRFLELLEASRINVDAALAPELHQQRELLAAEWATRNNAIRAAATSANPADLESLLAAQRELVERWNTLQSQIAHDLADEMLQLSPKPLRWNECQQWLRSEQPDTVLLAWTVGSEWSYLLVGDANGLDAYELSGRAALEFAVARLLWYAKKGPTRWADFLSANRTVVELLFGAALKAGLIERLRGKRIVVMPDGILYYLPFEMLLIQPPSANGVAIDASYGKTSKRSDVQVCADLLPAYLLNLGSVSVAQSASVWRMLQAQTMGESSALALGVYDVNYKTAVPPTGPGHLRAQELLVSYDDLAQTRAIAPVLKALERADTTVLALSAWDDERQPWPSASQSNEANFKRLLAEHRVRYVLFAGHGVFNDKYPQFSGMVFNLAAPDGSPPDSENPQDGFLGLNDIFNLQMPATELTFLAACQGGLGMIARGEGVNALTRALMYRGSPSVIASLWSVDVLATMDLVREFFTRLSADPAADKASLLTEAKRAVAQNPKHPQFAHPFYWAAFVLMGRR